MVTYNYFSKTFFKIIILFLIILPISIPQLTNGQATEENTLTINSINPSSGPQGEEIQVTINGIGFTEETRVYLRRDTYTINPAQTYFEPNSDGSLDLRIVFDIPINPNLAGLYNVTVWNPNGDKFMSQNGFLIISKKMELPELNIISVNPTVIERNRDTWVEIKGTGFVFIQDGSQINPDWEIGKPFYTHLEEPSEVVSYTREAGINLDRLEIINSTLWRVNIHVNPTVPPQELIFTMFNPNTEYYPTKGFYYLLENQNDPKQIDGFTLTVVMYEGEEEPRSSDRQSSCIIATTAFGSEIEPEVQFLREFRDIKVLSTVSGSGFMTAFNAFYYSWSPSVANVIRENDALRSITRGLITPLLGILSVSSMVFGQFQFSPEMGIIFAGLLASFLIGIVYLGGPMLIGALLSNRFSEKLKNKKVIVLFLSLIGSGIGFTCIGFLSNSLFFSITGSVMIVLSSMVFSSILLVMALGWVGNKSSKYFSFSKFVKTIRRH